MALGPQDSRCLVIVFLTGGGLENQAVPYSPSHHQLYPRPQHVVDTWSLLVGGQMEIKKIRGKMISRMFLLAPAFLEMRVKALPSGFQEFDSQSQGWTRSQDY